ncbi:MAG: VOC family protein [Pseudomonadota bacterium]
MGAAPKGRSTVAPFLAVEDVEAVLTFTEAVFDIRPTAPPLRRADGGIWNAELSLDGCSILLSEVPAGQARPGFVHVYVADADAAMDRALAAGGQAMMPVGDQFYGERAGGVFDPAGNIWWFAQHVRDMTAEDLQAAALAEEARRKGVT